MDGIHAGPERDALRFALVGFSIGPVQSFIATARTVRDLWAGSFTLAWLTAHGAWAVQTTDPQMAFVRPAMAESDLWKILEALEEGTPISDINAITGNPNSFIALVDPDQLEAIRDACVEAVHVEWKRICDKIHGALQAAWRDIPAPLCGLEQNDLHPWDWGWDAHLANYWDIFVAVQPPLDQTTLTETARRNGMIGAKEDIGQGALFATRIDLINRQMGQLKMVRHSSFASFDETASPSLLSGYDPLSDHRPKCIQSGEHPQTVPMPKARKDWTAIPTVADAFWKTMADRAHHGWERLQPKDRYGAPALVKRFAWTDYFSGRLGKRPQDKRIWDLATHAAMAWLEEHRHQSGGEKRLHEIIEDVLMQDQNSQASHWNGNWLRTTDRDGANDEDTVPAKAEALIRDACKLMRARGKGSPPAYYAVLVCDGDNMGDHQRDASLERLEQISKAIFAFARATPDIVTRHLGTLIYAGGEDVMAILPCATALTAAQELNQTYRDILQNRLAPTGGRRFTLSAGLTVAHCKQDLRYVLDQARATERHAKDRGRDRLAICALIGKVEPSRQDLPWGDDNENVATLERLVDAFAGGASNRWIYRTLQDWPKMSNARQVEANLQYWLTKSERAPKDQAQAFWSKMAHCQTEQANALHAFRKTMDLMLVASKLTRSEL